MSIIACKQVSAVLISNTAADFEWANNELTKGKFFFIPLYNTKLLDDALQRSRETVELGIRLNSSGIG